VGARIGDNTIVTTLDDLQSVELEFAISEQYFGIIQKNMQITAVSSAFEGKTFSGQITEVGSRIDAVSRSFSVRATLPNEDKALPSGMFMRIIIALEQNEAVSVPEEAIVAEGGGSYIFEVIDNKSIRKEISLGRRVPGFVEVTQGLEVGASVVVRGTNKVRSNGAVEIVDPNAPEKPNERPQVGGNAIGKAS
jgi:membrane fusion protein (multidrug efflux system)